jgi:hypothetical protein
MHNSTLSFRSNNFPRSQSFFEELKEVNSLKIAELERTIQEYESELKRLNEILQK